LVRPQGQGKTGHSLRDQLQGHGITDLEPGAVITVPDRKLNFPHNLISRKVHERRFAVVLCDHKLCSDAGEPLIVVVPMTHRLTPKGRTDVLIGRAPENGLLHDSLAQVILIQPLLKSDVHEKLGVLSDADYESILEHFVLMSARDI
jgi:PemK-like, MazF-like toxin of type II toxin-antitoxin system